ncbi:hypothetical protein D3C83_10820 [compost metagenome]
MNSQPESRQALAIRGYSVQTRAFTDSDGTMPSSSSTALMRQKPTRLPYSCQPQCGTSGSSVTPVGGGSTCRGIGRPMSHTSTLTTGHTTTRALSGSRSGGRSTMAE